MRKFYESVINSNGRPVPGAVVTVTKHPDSSAAVLYSDNGVTVLSGVLITDAFGYFEFYAEDARYNVSVTVDGAVKTITDLLVSDTVTTYPVVTGEVGVTSLAFPVGNVKRYGAVESDFVSDLTPIANAVASLNAIGYGTLSLPKGTFYRADATKFSVTASPFKMQGEGITQTVFKFDDFSSVSNARHDLFDFSGMPAGGQLEIADLTFEGQFQEKQFLYGGPINDSGTAQAGGASTITLRAGANSTTDGYYTGATIRTQGGTGALQTVAIIGYIAATRVATVATAWTIVPDNTTQYSIGDQAPGMALALIQLLEKVTVENVGFRYTRNQALQITRCRQVQVRGCYYYQCARGGTSIRRSEHCVVTDNIHRFGGDDAIFNSQESVISGSEARSRTTIIANNQIIDAEGMRFIGAQNLLISDNQIVRPIQKGIYVQQTAIAGGYQNQWAVAIRNNTIIDPINRNLVFGFGSAEGAGIILHNSSTVVAPSPGEYDGVSAIVLPENYFYSLLDSTASPAGQIGAYYYDISDNQILSTLKTGIQLSTINGSGFFNETGTVNGFTDPVLTDSHLQAPGLQIYGPHKFMRIAGNRIAARKRSCIEFLSKTSGLNVTTIDVDYALWGIDIMDNTLSRSASEPVIRMIPSSTTTRRVLVNIERNDIDGDPYFEASGRVGPINGSWTVATNVWGIDALRASGVSLKNNRFKNVWQAARISGQAMVENNDLFMVPAVLGDSASNKGIGFLPPSCVEYRVIHWGSDPTNANFRSLISNPLLEKSSIPTTGFYVAGHLVRNNAPAVGVAWGWARITTGSAHVAGTDWLVLLP